MSELSFVFLFRATRESVMQHNKQSNNALCSCFIMGKLNRTGNLRTMLFKQPTNTPVKLQVTAIAPARDVNIKLT